MEEPLKIIAATQGSFVLNDTSEFTGNFDAIVVLEDTIFNKIEIDGTDVISDYISNPSGTVKLGAIIRPNNTGNLGVPIKFNSVQLDSGSIAIVL
jgi:hypothetical protein